jgi:predicted nucleotidyltransferase
VPSSGSTEFLRIVRLLSSADCDFVIIGGLALQILGGDYITQDVDFALTRRRENCRKIADVLTPFHPKPVDWPEGVPFVWDDQTLMNSTHLTLETDLGRIDFLAEPDGAPPYEELKNRAVRFDLEGRTVRVASIDDLIAMKRAAGRPKDIAHIAELETIKRLNAEKDAGT